MAYMMLRKMARNVAAIAAVAGWLGTPCIAQTIKNEFFRYGQSGAVAAVG
jgi:hypothetical protein